MTQVIKSTRFIRITPDTCRVCLRDLQRNLLKDLSEYADNLQEIEPKTLADVYQISTGYGVYDRAGTPTKICFVCEATLVKLYTFRQEVDIAEASLAQLLLDKGNIGGRPVKVEVDEDIDIGMDANKGSMSAESIQEHHLLDTEEEEQIYDEDGTNEEEQGVRLFNTEEYVISEDTEVIEERLEIDHDVHYPDTEGVEVETIQKNTNETEESFAVRMITIPDMVNRRRFQPDGKNHECSICFNKYKTASQLRSHLVTHSDERQFQCSICNKKFKTKKTLKGHEETHSTELSYLCYECKQGFTNKTALRVHNIRRHGAKKGVITVSD